MADQFGEKLRSLRVQKDLTQTELAQSLSSSFSHISNIEAGRKSPSALLIVRIADVFGVTTDFLLRGSLPAQPPGVSSISSTLHDVNTASVLIHFGEKLRQLRLQRGLLQAELADQLGLRTQAHISLLETGRKEPSLGLLCQIADLFGVTTDYLLRDDLPVEPSTKQ